MSKLKRGSENGMHLSTSIVADVKNLDDYGYQQNEDLLDPKGFEELQLCWSYAFGLATTPDCAERKATVFGKGNVLLSNLYCDRFCLCLRKKVF